MIHRTAARLPSAATVPSLHCHLRRPLSIAASSISSSLDSRPHFRPNPPTSSSLLAPSTEAPHSSRSYAHQAVAQPSTPLRAQPRIASSNSHKSTKAPQRSTWRDRLSPTLKAPSTLSESLASAPEQNAKPKRFLDSYLLVEHVARKLKQGRTDDALNDIRHSPAANGQAPVWNRILLVYASQGRFGKTLDLFNEMKKRGAVPDAHSWSHLFTSLGLSTSPNKAAEAQRLFVRLVSDKAQHLTAYSYNAYLKSLAMSGSSHLLSEALDKPPENVKLDCATLTIILNALARATQPAHVQQTDDSGSHPKQPPPSMVSVESIRAVIAHISDTGIDADLFAALCAATAKCRGADPAVPLQLLARAAPQAFGKDILQHLPPLSAAIPSKVFSHGLIAPMPTKAANWALMMAHRLDSARPPCSSASPDASSPTKPAAAASTTAVGDPILTERVYATLSSSRIRAQFDSLSMDVLFAAMAQSQQARRAPVLIRMYLDAYHSRLSPKHLPKSLKSLQPVAALECNGPDPSHAAFASLLHATRGCAYILAESTPVSEPEGAPLMLDLLNHYARVTDGELWVRSDSEIAAVAQLGRALILPPARPMAAGSWRAPLKQSKLTQVMDHLLWVLGLRPGSRPVRKLHQLPLPVLNQCLAMCMWARANMPKTQRFSKEKWDERVRELEDACHKVEERGLDPEWQGRRVGRNGGSKKAPKPREQEDVVLKLFKR